MRITVMACDKCGKYFLPDEKGDIYVNVVHTYGADYDLCEKCLGYYNEMFRYYVTKYQKAVNTIQNNAAKWLREKEIKQ